jgi:hypothetical protein
MRLTIFRFHPHIDGRFADSQLGYLERNDVLKALVQSYLSAMVDIGVETWLMHGTLIGWWWNRKVSEINARNQ